VGRKVGPVLFFMHALNLGWEWYKPQAVRWASHGIPVVFPFIKSQTEDDHVPDKVFETDGTHLVKALDFMKNAVTTMSGSFDMDNIAFAGHNMGAVSAMRVAAKSPTGTAKLVIALHPFICDLGPPPPPYTISSKEIIEANKKAGLLYFTSEDDKAFNLLQNTTIREKNCFKKAMGVGSAIFASFSSAACEAYPDCTAIVAAEDCANKVKAFSGKGHMCPAAAPGASWTSPEEKWITTALRLYLQQGLTSSSACYKQLFEQGADSLSNDKNVAEKILETASRDLVV